MKTKAGPKKAVEVHTLSNSEATTFLACRRKWFWRHVKNYVPIMEPTPLIVGRAWHAFLEAFYKQERFEDETLAAESFKEATKGAFLSEDQLADLEKQRAMVVGMMRAYKQVYADDLEKYEPIAVEKQGKFKIRNGWDMYFTVDMAVKRRDDGTTWIMEHKSTSFLEADYVLRLDIDTQIPTYLTGVERAWGMKPKGVIYNAVRKPAIRQKQSEERGAYLKRVVAVYEEAPSEYLFRAEYLKGKEDLDIFFRDLNGVTKDMDAARASGFFPMNSRECFNHGRCPYLALCARGEEASKDLYRVKKDTRYQDIEEA